MSKEQSVKVSREADLCGEEEDSWVFGEAWRETRKVME